MGYKIVVLTQKNIDALSALNADYSSFGLRWPTSAEWYTVKTQAITLGWVSLFNIALIVQNEKQWLLTRLKYGI